jgi:hypothetical protein
MMGPAKSLLAEVSLNDIPAILAKLSESEQHQLLVELEKLQELKDKEFVAMTSRQIGKEQPYSALVLTPTGYKTMGSLQIGDYVYSEDGKPTRVTNIFEQGIKDVYISQTRKCIHKKESERCDTLGY